MVIKNIYQTTLYKSSVALLEYKLVKKKTNKGKLEPTQNA